MAIAFKRGDTVKQVLPVLQGTVVESKVIEDDICFLVSYVGADGESHERWFKESELEAV